MVVLLVAIVVGSLVLLAIGVLPWWAATAACVGILVLAIWNFDRNRRPGAPSPVRDPNRPEFYAPIADEGWEVPTSYIDHPSGAGPPPGVEKYDERNAERSAAGRERL